MFEMWQVIVVAAVAVVIFALLFLRKRGDKPEK